MAPKRPTKVVRTVVKAQRKVVEESVEVSVVREAATAASVPGGSRKTTEIPIEETGGGGETQDIFQNSSDVDTQDIYQNSLEGGGREVKAEPASAKAPATTQQEKLPEGERTTREPTASIEDAETQEEEETTVQADAAAPAPRDEDEKKKKKKRSTPATAGGELHGREKSGRKRRRSRMGGEKGSGGGVGGEKGYKRYVFRVLKQVHPGMGASSMAMTVLDGLMKDMFDRIVEEATRLSKISGKATLSAREIQGAVRLVLPGDLGKHAVAEGIKAVSKYMDAVAGAA